jgi:hypothetical protein
MTGSRTGNGPVKRPPREITINNLLSFVMSRYVINVRKEMQSRFLFLLFNVAGNALKLEGPTSVCGR